jgi:hypothetical protein
LILVGGFLSLVYVVPVLTTDIDPNLMKRECPGGKEWDLPGSSCHGGLIADYPVTIDGKLPGKPLKNNDKRSRKGKR